jgi:hypothetical protein
MKTTVIHHSADFDGLFCREIARKFLPDAELIGWDFGDKPLEIPPEGQIYILDLPVDRVFGDNFSGRATTKYFCHDDMLNRVIWIDHHKSSIESHPTNIPGYRIDGVAACRLAWQFFYQGALKGSQTGITLPEKNNYVDRRVTEPLAVQLAGEYDIWDKRDPRAEVFQFGLRSRVLTPDIWETILGNLSANSITVDTLLADGEMLQRYQQNQDASLMYRSLMVGFEGLRFLALNTSRCNSLTFASKDIPETGHDALMGFYWTGKAFKVSLYHAKHRTDIDLSQIAVKHGGGGHRGACGFETGSLPFVP